MTVKKFLKFIAAVAVVAVIYQTVDHYRPHPVEPMTTQRRSSHRIEYESKSGSPLGWCTGTAIGPHAILTATHCNSDSEKTDIIELDEAVQKFHIERTLTDGADHDIYLVDGPEFKNTVPYVTRPATLGEHVYIYGSGHAVYPPRRLDGVVLRCIDPSEVDAAAGIEQFTIPVIPGDSGSAVFTDDGSIVAVTTYRRVDPWMFGFLSDDSSIDFSLQFTTEQVVDALTFKPERYRPPVTKSEKKPPAFNPFFFLQ